MRRNKLYWDELRQCGVARPQRGQDDGYQRPDPRYCHDYGRAAPEVKPTPKILAAMSKMEDRLGVDQATRDAAMARAKRLAEH